jgi:phage toprim domain containing protein, yorJ B.subtilis homolog
MSNNDITFINLLKNNKYLLFEYLKIKNIRYNVNIEETSLRMDSINSNNYNGLILSLNTMTFYDFKSVEKGTVLELLSILTNLNKDLIMFEFKMLSENINYKFQKIENNVDYEFEKKELLEYPKKLLDLFPCVISDLFLNDGINETTQVLFDIKYDKETDRILIPVIFKDKLVGIIGRYNNFEVPKKIPKYYPILSYPKSEVLFGYDLCKNKIIETKTVILVESEKSVMKSIQRNMYNTLAIGGSNISNSQIELLKELNVKNIFISLDSDKDRDSLLTQINKWFKNETDFNIYLIDNNTKYVNEKSCIFDMNWSKEITLKYIKKFNYKVK